MFDGARSFEGVTADLALHCERVVNSWRAFTMNLTVSAHEMVEIASDSVAKFSSGAELYIRPMFWAQEGWIAPDPNQYNSKCWSMNRRCRLRLGSGPACRRAADQAITDATASCLYPNAGRAMKEAAAWGFDNAVVLDPNGNVAEFATSNLFTVADGVAHTPIPNGTFLNGITRQRVINLQRGRDVKVVERSLTLPDLVAAAEIFSTGNHSKVVLVIRYEEHDLQPGPVSQLARDLYWEYAHLGD